MKTAIAHALRGAAAGAAVAAAAAPAGAETLAWGFDPDPVVVATVAGGRDPAADLAEGCAGYIDADAPYVFAYEGGEDPLALYAESGGIDLVLAVRTPSGSVRCSDDFPTASGGEPGIAFAAPESGDYAVWVGTYHARDAGADAALSLTGRGLDPWPGAPRPAEIVEARALPAARETTAGGAAAAAVLADGCEGYVDADEPAWAFDYRAGSAPLAVYAESARADLVLAVRAPSGEILCNDDFPGAGGAPGIEFAEPENGDYAVWVGTYHAGDSGAPATLALAGALLDPWPGQSPSVEFIGAGFIPDPRRIDLAAGGFAPAGERFPGCEGYIAAEADHAFRYEAGDYPLRFWEESAADTTLVVTSPSGETLCNDDHPRSAGGAPGVAFDAPPSGAYRVWVGTRAPGAFGADAVLAISELDFPWDDGSETSWGGTAFFVDTHLLATNRHVVDGCGAIAIRRPGEAEQAAALVASNAAVDLALLRVGTGVAEDIPAAVRGFPRLRLGEDAIVFGFPERGLLSPGGILTAGVVTGLGGGSAGAQSGARSRAPAEAETGALGNDLFDDLSQFQLSAGIYAGGSGSAVLDNRGNVIGVAVSTLDGSSGGGGALSNVNFAVRAGVLLTFLETHRFGRAAVVSSGAALPTPDIADRARAFTASVSCRP